VVVFFSYHMFQSGGTARWGKGMSNWPPDLPRGLGPRGGPAGEAWPSGRTHV
jgi:hypothetical protein